MIPQPAPLDGSAQEYQAIMAAMQHYIDGGRSGRSDLMRPVFHPDATIVGYCGGLLLTGPIQQLFDWIDVRSYLSGSLTKQRSDPPSRTRYGSRSGSIPCAASSSSVAARSSTA